MKRLYHPLRCLLLCVLMACAITVPAAALTDVPDDFWAKTDINRSVSLKYFYAEPDGSFGVGEEMSRAEFLTVLCRFLGWRAASSARQIYEDVPAEAWYAGVVETAYHQGILTSQDESFHPDTPITRDEAASMLIRALGYGNIAGLVKDISLPFRDVQANNGYVAMAYALGLMDGTSFTAFSPQDHVTREQAAVIIMRLHDKLNNAVSSRIGIVSSAEGLPHLKNFEAVCVAAAKLAYNGAPQVVTVMGEDEISTIQAAIAQAGSKAVLYVTGGTYHMREGDSELMAEALLQAMREGGYQGLFLDISGLTSNAQCQELSAIARLLREGLNDHLLFIGAEAPSWNGTIFGYDYAVLGELSDRLLLRVDQEGIQAGGRSLAPLEPLERVYFGLSRLRGVVDANKLTLLLTSTASDWDGEKATPLTLDELTFIMEERETKSHYSDRYACAYLTRDVEDANTIWYLNGQAVQERIQLARLFGAGRVCLSDLNNALPEVIAATLAVQ